MTVIGRVIGLLVVILSAGCAGTDFKQPDSQALVLGKSTAQDIVRVMGQPRQTAEGLKNEQKVRSMTYAYAQAHGESLYPSTVPARAMVLTTHNDVLVGQEFVSSFKADGTDFDDAKIGQIIKGKTTRSEVTALLGKPNGEALYPLTKERDARALVYAYSHVKQRMMFQPFQVYRKALVVSIGPGDVVTDVEFSSSGQR